LELSHTDGTPVWIGRVPATADEIKVTIPVSMFAPGDYLISVAGIDADGTREELGDQTLTVVAAQSKSR
jgi:hypothetical protein